MSLFDTDEKQVILGAVPSKSNCYVLIAHKIKNGEKHRAAMVKSHRLRKYEEAFYLQCNRYRNAKIQGHFTLEADVYFPTKLSDLDNCLKVILDCLEDVAAFENDNMCVRVVANKYVDKTNPRIEFTVKPVKEA